MNINYFHMVFLKYIFLKILFNGYKVSCMYEKVYLERAFKTAESVQIKDKDRLRNLLYIKGD